MRVLDWLFGGGWGLGTALLTALLGMGVYFVTGGTLGDPVPNHTTGT